MSLRACPARLKATCDLSQLVLALTHAVPASSLLFMVGMSLSAQFARVAPPVRRLLLAYCKSMNAVGVLASTWMDRLRGRLLVFRPIALHGEQDVVPPLLQEHSRRRKIIDTGYEGIVSIASD